jgi:hypothetical protein
VGVGTAPSTWQLAQTGKLREKKAAPAVPGVTVISIIKDEFFYLPAFLDHYRRLGVSRFVFLDDRSTDEGPDYLMRQADCALVVSDLTFAQTVDGKKVHVIWRTELARAYCDGQWALVVDVDEFLELPPGFESLEAFTLALDAQGCSAVGAVMVDFYPEHSAGLELSTPPASAAELFARYPYFDDCPHGQWLDGRNEFQRTYGGVRARLVAAHGIEQPGRKLSLWRRMKQRVRQLVGREKPKSFNAIQKVHLIRWSDQHEYLSARTTNVAPCDGIQLPLAHFKFTGSLARKIETAIASGAYHGNSSEYHAYERLLSEMKRTDASFLCSYSRKYADKSDLLKSGLLRFGGLASAEATSSLPKI